MPDKKTVSMEDLHGINITSGVPSEIHVGIGRGHYDDEPEPLYAVARDVAAAFTETATKTAKGIYAEIISELDDLARRIGPARQSSEVAREIKSLADHYRSYSRCKP